ncbi:MAG: ThuA domain-containing protein [Planctomycetota bacterium]
MRLSLVCLFLSAVAFAADPPKTRKVVLIAGPLDGGHPAGTHEYEKTVRAFKHCLDNATNVKGVRVEAHLAGWPDRPGTLDDADTIVLVSSGSDRRAADHPLLVGDRLAVIEKQMNRGCGLCLIHWSTFVPKEAAGDKVLEWVGGYFDYQSGPAVNGWYSKIQTVTVKAMPGLHAITAGIEPFETKDEFYYNIRFRERDPRLVPILTVPIGKKGEKAETVAWAVERKDGGRGFGFTGGHFFDNWRSGPIRRMALNAILWTAKTDVPAVGVESEFPDDRELSLVTVGSTSQVLILTGHDGPFHNWRETSQALKHVIERDGRLECRIATDPECLAREDLLGYDLIVQNYVNWERAGLSDAAKQNLLTYLAAGRGLAVIHFANGAFHPSLPKPAAGDGDWPEYRKIVRRVWDHGQGLSGHDPFGPIKVAIAATQHPITEGMQPFETRDELYYRQQGDMTIEPLVTAKSRDTRTDEPLAWAYSYGKARVFQTVLGHAAESIRADGPATLFRRGCAWAAGRELTPEQPAPAVSPVEKQLAFAAGRFGKALDARMLPASIEGDDRYRKPPLTVECWANLNSKDGFNVLVSADSKSSGQHWELYTYAGRGDLSAYLPGTLQGEIRSGVDVCDGKWHHVAMTHDGNTLTLYVDGKAAREAAVEYRPEAKPEAGPLVIGGAYAGDHTVNCDGLIDDVRISNVVRPIEVPTAALERDGNTVSLWNLDGDEGISADTNWTPPTVTGATEPWQRETDRDWVDSRFASTDTGPCQNATIDYEGPNGKLRAYKGTAIKVGEKGEWAVLFDRSQLRFAAAWTGGFLDHSSRRFALLNTPTPHGTMVFSTSGLAGWADDKGNFESPHSPTGPLPKEWARFIGMNMNGKQVVIAHTAPGGGMVFDHPWAIPTRDSSVILRQVAATAPKTELKCLAAELPSHGRIEVVDGTTVATSSDGKSVCAVLFTGRCSLGLEGGTRVVVTLPVAESPYQFRLGFWTGPAGGLAEAIKAFQGWQPRDLDELRRPGPIRWNKKIETNLQTGLVEGSFVLDTFQLPYENPWNALFFVSGVDFLPDGHVVICTAHGDVWTCREAGDKLEWRRFATGLYQSLGLKVVDGKVVVVERGQLTRLHDDNDDGEADYYENLNNDWHCGGGEHSYDTCLETDLEGNFYLFKTGDDHTPTGGCLLKISKDGSRMEVFCTGFRHPNGMGMSPDGRISGADQEGNWMPVTRLDMYKKGGFYGDMRTHHRPVPPATYDEPLLWLPREADNSAGGQLWLPEGSFGALGGKMLHLSYGQCKAYAILPDGDRFQAAAADVGLNFLSGSARARVHPETKAAYVVGLDGWQTAARKDGSLQRVRYSQTGYTFPIGFSVEMDGVTLKFDRPLDPASVADLAKFTVARWNSRWSADYGSKKWSVEHPQQEGVDVVKVTAATLVDPMRQTLRLKFDMKPAMQVKIGYDVQDATGKRLAGSVYSTIRTWQ